MATKKKMLQAAAGQAGGAGGAALDITEVFSTYLYEGTGAAQTITNDIDLAGEGGLVWVKSRTTAFDHMFADTETGVQKYLSSNTTQRALGPITTALTSFNSNGFSIGSLNDYSYSGDDFASWTFRKAPKFFDVVTWTGNGAVRQIPHNLGSTVGMIIVKRTDTSGYNWYVYHTSNGSSGAMALDTTDAFFTYTALWNNTAPTSTHFTVGNNGNVNESGGTYVAYLFAHNDGDGEFGPDGDQDIIKCGSFTTNSDGSLDLVDLGFEPQWLMIKNSSTTGNWDIHDVMRDGTLSTRLRPNTSDAELSYSTQYLKAEATGFSAIAGWGGASNTKIYIAIRRGPLAQPESGTEVFAMDGFTARTSGSWFRSGFPVDFALRARPNNADEKNALSRLTGDKMLRTDSTGAEVTSGNAQWDWMDGYGDAVANSSYFSWMWKRAPGFCDVVATPISSAQMSGPPSSSYNPAHNLGVTPEMIWVKDRDNTDNWYVYHSALGTSQKLILNTADPASSSSWAVASDNFNFYAFGNANGNAICYLFATLPGVSKVGSYTGNGSNQTIDCGFTSGARFVLIKNTEQGRGWVTIDTTRGLTSGDDKVLYLNATNAQSDLDFIDPNSSGFTLSTSNDQVNASGRNYIFYAIA